jgi:hypothetical protein
MLTTSDLAIEAKRLLNQQAVGVATVSVSETNEVMVYINKGKGDVIDIKVPADDMGMTLQAFSARHLAPKLKEGIA